MSTNTSTKKGRSEVVNDSQARQKDQATLYGAWASLIRDLVAEKTLSGGFGSMTSNCGYYHPGPYGHEQEDTAAFIRAMKRRGATVTKEWPDNDEEYGTVQVTADFTESTDPHLLAVGTIRALVSRNAICERVEVARRIEVKEERDPEAVRAALENIPVEERPVEVIDYAWECHSILGSA